jgi:hypothetical protein
MRRQARRRLSAASRLGADPAGVLQVAIPVSPAVSQESRGLTMSVPDNLGIDQRLGVRLAAADPGGHAGARGSPPGVGYPNSSRVRLGYRPGLLRWSFRRSADEPGWRPDGGPAPCPRFGPGQSPLG